MQLTCLRRHISHRSPDHGVWTRVSVMCELQRGSIFPMERKLNMWNSSGGVNRAAFRTLNHTMQSNSTNHNYSVNLSDAGSTKMHDYELNKDTFVSLCCTDLAFTESTPRGFSNRGARSSHFVCAAQQQGRVVSVGGVAAYIDYCGRAQLLHAASRRDVSLPCMQLPKIQIFPELYKRCVVTT